MSDMDKKESNYAEAARQVTLYCRTRAEILRDGLAGVAESRDLDLAAAFDRVAGLILIENMALEFVGVDAFGQVAVRTAQQCRLEAQLAGVAGDREKVMAWQQLADYVTRALTSPREHIAEFRTTTWYIQHPPTCPYVGALLRDCPVEKAAIDAFWTAEFGEPGLYRITLTDAGTLQYTAVTGS
jgi:hypothetical protein